MISKFVPRQLTFTHFYIHASQKACENFPEKHSNFIFTVGTPTFSLCISSSHPHCWESMMWIYSLRNLVRLRVDKLKNNSNKFVELPPPDPCSYVHIGFTVSNLKYLSWLSSVFFLSVIIFLHVVMGTKADFKISFFLKCTEDVIKKFFCLQCHFQSCFLSYYLSFKVQYLYECIIYTV